MSTSVAVLSEAFAAVHALVVPYLEMDSVVVLSEGELVPIYLLTHVALNGAFAVTN